MDSILKQSFREIEVICVNDGAADASPAILQEYEVCDERVVVLHQTNQGVSAARNAGMKKAQGEYICFVDGDDMLVPDALRILWDAVENEEIEIVVYETAPLLYENETLKRMTNKDAYYAVKNAYPGIGPGREFFVRMVENNDLVDSAWLVFVKLNWLKEQGIVFCPGMLFEDSVFIIQCYFTCKKMKHLRERLYIYRVRENSIMTGKSTFKHMLSRIWQFSECLRAIYTLAKSEREIKALSNFAAICVANIQHMGYHLDESELRKVEKLDALYGLFVKSMDVGNSQKIYNKEIVIEGLLTAMRRHSSIVLYGAGLVGNKVEQFMDENNLSERLLGFAVSFDSGESMKNGRPLRYIGDYAPAGDTLVIVSARESYHRDMVNLARQLGFPNLCVIDYIMERMIDEQIARKSIVCQGVQ